MDQSAEARRQKRYRYRKALRAEMLRLALEMILIKLEGNDKPLAVELRALAEHGLNGSLDP